MSDLQAVIALKGDLRRRTLAARDQLRKVYREACSLKLVSFLDMLGPLDNKVVSGYWPIKSEIDPRPLMMALKERGARLALPVVLNRTTIVFRSFEDESALIDAGFGTKGPHEDAPELVPDLMLIPLSVFDCFGGRIGYGAGYYDRAISKFQKRGVEPQKIGLAFALQEVPLVPQDKFDIRLDKILTHEGIILTDMGKGA